MFDKIYENIDANILKCVNLSNEELDFFHSLLDYKFIKKKTILFKENENSYYEAYIKKGVVRTYFIDENGNETNLIFALEDWWFGNTISSSYLNIQTLEDCEVFIITKENKEKLFEKVPKFERVFRLMIEKHLAYTQKRLVNNSIQNAEEKYLDFLNRYPNLSQRIPQHYIASYLGISAEFLSKTRKKMLTLKK